MAANRGQRTALLTLAGIILIGGAWVIGPYIFAGQDHAESLDSAVVREAARAACTDMQAAVEANPGVEGAAVAAEEMVARVRALGPDVLAADVPAAAWLEDWERLVAARRAGEPVPRAEGAPIHRRMDDLVKDMRECQVPVVLIR